MNSQDDPLPKGGQLRDEAADWFAQMRGPDAESHRAEFEAWLARGALHRSAYNRVAETFALGKSLKGRGLDAAAPAKPATTTCPPKRRRFGLLTGLAAVTLSAGTILFLNNPLTCK